jgi:hypothetical protein
MVGDMSSIVYNADAGRFIDSNQNRIAQLIQEYNPQLSLGWIPPEHRKESNLPEFAVLCTPEPGREPYVVFYVKESEMDSRVLARIYLSDRKNGDPVARMESTEAAVKALKEREFQDEMAEAHDMAYHILKSRKNWYKHNGKTYRG